MIDILFRIGYTIYRSEDRMMDDVVEQLKQIIKDLVKELQAAKDENDALWFMLDEIKASDIAAKRGMEEARDEMLVKLIASHGPVGEA